MESMLHEIARHIAIAIEVMAIVIIAFGALEALIAIVRLWMRADATNNDRPHHLDELRPLAGCRPYIPVGGRSRRQSFEPTWDEIGHLAAIAAIRTFLSYFLDREWKTRASESSVARDVGMTA